MKEATECTVGQEPAAKFEPGQIVKVTVAERGYVYYNYVVDSYYNDEINMHMYRLNERMAMPIWREDWLEPVSDEEIAYVNATERLRPGKLGGWEHTIEEVL